MKRFNATAQTGRVLIILLISVFVMIATGCPSAGSGGGGNTLPVVEVAQPPMMPSSLTGGSGGVSGSFAASQVTASYDGQDELLDEYGGFIILPETGMNYNQTMTELLPTITTWAQEYAAGSADWQPAEAPYVTQKSFVVEEYGRKGIIRGNADFSHFEITLSALDGSETTHYEVRQYEEYTHGFKFSYRTSGDDAVDMVDIVSTDDWTFTKTMRIFNFDNVMDGDGRADLRSFAGINRNDSNERVLGVLKEADIAYTTGTYTFESPAENSTATNGAFDSVQLAIRPDERPADPQLWQEGDLGGDQPYSGFGDGTVTQGETFDASLFPALSDVQKLFDVGPEIGEIQDWVINPDLSRNYTFPEWDPADIDFDELTP